MLGFTHFKYELPVNEAYLSPCIVTRFQYNQQSPSVTQSKDFPHLVCEPGTAPPACTFSWILAPSRLRVSWKILLRGSTVAHL